MMALPKRHSSRPAHEAAAPGLQAEANPSATTSAGNENCLLSELQFLCAHTNRTIGTGIWTEARALALASRRGCVMRLRCPHCGMTHQLDVSGAALNRSLRREDGISADLLGALPILAG